MPVLPLLICVCSNSMSDSWRGVMLRLLGSLHLHSLDVELVHVVCSRLNSCSLKSSAPMWLHLPPSLHHIHRTN